MNMQWLRDFLAASWIFLCQVFYFQDSSLTDGVLTSTGGGQPVFKIDGDTKPEALNSRLVQTCWDRNFTSSIPEGRDTCDSTSTGDPISCCNTPTSRAAWCGGYDICSNYEDTQVIGTQPLPYHPKIQRNKQYTVEVVYSDISPDGYLKRNATTFNGTYPGPLLEAIWGQNLQLTVINKLGIHKNETSNGTSIHAHGLRLWHRGDQDGVPGVTQCPIAPGRNYTYTWPITQYATTWYHSHLSLQYPNGVVGPMVIHGPKTADWDNDIGPVLLTDWYHANPFEKYHDELLGMLSPDSTLINGQGKFNCTGIPDPENCIHEGSYWTTQFEPGKKHILRLVNTATQTTFRVSIDGHNMTVVTADFTPIRPVTVDWIDLAVGQRYEVIVNANYTFGDFWLRADPLYCNKAQIHRKKGISPENIARGVIRYGASFAPPDSFSHIPDDQGIDCVDMDTDDLVPVYVRTPGYIKAKDAYQQSHNNFEVTLVDYPTMINHNTTGIKENDSSDNMTIADTEMHLWKIADYSLKINWSEPALLMQQENPEWSAKDFPNIYAVVDAGSKGIGSTNVVMHINGSVDKDTSKFLIGNRNVAHPIHIHGHDFVILAQGPGNIDPDNIPDKIYNPTRRDVAMMPGDGYLLLSFPVDNAGIWLLHCHIAWHASQGLALLILEKEQSSKAVGGGFGWKSDKKYGAMGVDKQLCDDWNAYLAKGILEEMEDSGV